MFLLTWYPFLGYHLIFKLYLLTYIFQMIPFGSNFEIIFHKYSAESFKNLNTNRNMGKNELSHGDVL